MTFRIQDSVETELRDLSSNHEDADLINAQHAISGYINQENVRVVSDGTAVFILLLHLYAALTALYMSSRDADRILMFC